MMKSEASLVCGLGCVVGAGYLGLVAFGLWLGAVLFQYSLFAIVGKDVAWYVDVIGGAICSAALVPVAFACWLAQLIGYAAPFIQ